MIKNSESENFKSGDL